MEPYFEDRETEEDREFLARCERRRLMRLARQKRLRRKRILKRFLYLGVLVIVVAAAVFVRSALRSPAVEESLPREQAGADMLDGAMGQEADGTDGEHTDGLDGTAGQAADQGAIEETALSEPEMARSDYRFTRTPDTVNIACEEVISTNAILVDESKDTVIASKGADERIYPASMTKVLTVLVAAEQMTAEQLEEELEDTFTMTLEITDYAYINDCSCVGFVDGEKVTVRDLFYGTVLPSGGDAALGLAVYTAGSQEAFVEKMNEKLEELGIGDSAHFTNCIGLHDENHYCTVYDMAVIMKAAMQNTLCREVLSAHTYTTAPTAEHPEGITISNWFLRKIEDKDTGGEVLCAKTGYTDQSRNCAVSYGSFAGGTPYICVTTGSTSGWRCIYDHVEIYNRYVLREGGD